MAIRRYNIKMNYTIEDIETAAKQECTGFKTVTTYLAKNSAEFNELIDTAIEEFIDELDEGLCDVENIILNDFKIIEV